MTPLSPEVLRFTTFLLNYINQDLSNHLAEIEAGNRDSQIVVPVVISPSVGTQFNLRSRCDLPNERYYSGNDKCYELKTQGPCPPNQLFVEDSNGGGTCNCINRNYLLSSETAVCYKRNSQGPCDEGDWFTVEEGSSDGTPVCEPIPEGCIADGKHIYMTVDDPSGKKNKKECMELGTQGPCADDEVLYRLEESEEIVCRPKKASGNKVNQVQSLLENIWTRANEKIDARNFKCKPGGKACPPARFGFGFG